MVNFRRNKVPGGTYFFTVTLRNRRSRFLLTYIDSFRHAIKQVKKTHPFQINAIVVLPEHVHTIWTLPANDDGYSKRWNLIKGLFTQDVIKKGIRIYKDKRNEYNLWQRRFWEHTIKDDVDMLRHINFIHYNPVKHGLVTHVLDWPYSSFHQFVKKGMLALDWSDSEDDDEQFGE